MKAAASYDSIYYFAREIGARPAKNWSPCACLAWQGEWKRHVKKESTSLFLSLAVYRLLAVSIVLTMNLIQVQYIQILRRKIQVSSKGVRQTWPPPSLFLSPSLSLPPNLPTNESNLGFKPSWGGTKESIIRPVTCWQRHELMRISNIQRMIFFLLEFFIDRSASRAFRREERFPLYIVWI